MEGGGRGFAMSGEQEGGVREGGLIADGRAWLVRVDTTYRVAVPTETAQEWIGVSDG